MGDRWLFEVLSPVNGEVLWSYSCRRSQDVPKKWFLDTGNKYLSKAKVNRATVGELNCPFIRCYKINKYAESHINRKIIPVIAPPPTPTLSEFSDTSLDDYSTTGETTDNFSSEDEA